MQQAGGGFGFGGLQQPPPPQDGSFRFNINPADYLGIDHEAYKTEMLQLALTNPADYFELRKTALDRIKRLAVQQQYGVYYWLLTEGTLVGQNNTNSAVSVVNGIRNNLDRLFVPKVPRQKVNEFALKAAKTIDAIAEEAIELLLPMNFKKIAEDRQGSRTAGNLGFG